VLLGMVVAAGGERRESGLAPRGAVRGGIFRRNPYTIDGRNLFYAPSIGTDSGFADLIIEQANLAAKS